ncbi:major facilitator superfamily domain-containing protein, partial [Favolaschia claudopus]
SLFLIGWNDATAGPLIPRIQKVYNVNFAVVSLIFVLACVGFIVGALINVPLSNRLPFGTLLALASVCQVIAYAIQAPAPPFPVFAASFVLSGVGIAIQDAQANGYIASLKHNPEIKMGLLHGAYECLQSVGEAPGEATSSNEHPSFKQILGMKTVHLLAFFILVYVGMEVTIGGWIVTYIQDVRGGNPATSGYVSAGFFGGLMVGRIALLWLNSKIGERRVMYLYSILAIGLELVVWLVPSLIADAVAVSIIGVLLGPIYPITMNHTGRVLPRRLLTGSIGWIAGFGQAGSAVFPFITGAIASKTGIKALHPLCGFPFESSKTPLTCCPQTDIYDGAHARAMGSCTRSSASRPQAVDQTIHRFSTTIPISCEELSGECARMIWGVERLPTLFAATEGPMPTTASTTHTAPSRSKQHVFRERVQLAGLYWCYFLIGWNDATAGPLIPRIQKVYNVMIVNGCPESTLIILVKRWLRPFQGFILGALMNIPLSNRLSFGKLMVLGSICQIIAYVLQAPAPPFPVFVASFFLNGVGIAIQDAQANGYVASLRHSPEIKMGLLHGAYGAGALVSPLVATQFSQLRHWSFHYLISLGIAITNTVILIWIFRLKTQDECLEVVGEGPIDAASTNEHSSFRQILSMKTVHLLAFFILVYVGMEVTIGGWIVTYIQDVRGGNPSTSGYVSAGFFGGLMIGRVALLWLNSKIGERRVMYLYSVLAIGLELVVWLVPFLIADAVAVAIVGMLLGPIYPITMNHTGRVLPRRLLTGSIGWIAGFGQAGSAVFPFITGAIASKTGIKVLHPLLISMMALMLGLWALVPASPHRVD